MVRSIFMVLSHRNNSLQLDKLLYLKTFRLQANLCLFLLLNDTYLAMVEQMYIELSEWGLNSRSTAFEASGTPTNQPLHHRGENKTITPPRRAHQPLHHRGYK